MCKNSAFTLAEILITLTVVGIVASMTIPTMFQKSSEEEFKAAFRKVVSSLSGAANVNYAQTGIDFSKLESDNSSDAVGAPSLKSILKTRMAVVSTDKSLAQWDASIPSDAVASTYTFADNSMIGFNTSNIGNCYSIGTCVVYVDVNGPRPPNRLSTAVAKGSGVMGDQFKVYLYNRFAAPADDAAKYALYRN